MTIYRSAFPIECSQCHHTENYTKGLVPFFFGDEFNINTVKPIAIDCEMVGVGPKKLSGLARVSIVDYHGNLLYDVMVRPDETITDFRTPWSGILPSDMLRSIPFECAQEQVGRLIRNRIIVGHMIHNDLSALRISHPSHLIRDTAKSPFPNRLAGFQPKPSVSLQKLTFRLFGVHIQDGKHCSTEDARATMAIYRLVENDLENSQLSSHRHGKQQRQSQDCVYQRSPMSRKRSDQHMSPSLWMDDQVSGHRSLSNNSSSHSFLLDDVFWPANAIDTYTDASDE